MKNNRFDIILIHFALSTELKVVSEQALIISIF